MRRAEIDHGMLAQGVFTLTALEAIMPDGLLLIHEPAFGQLLLRLSDSQVDELQNQGRQLKLYLAVTVADSADAQGGAGRYRNSADGEPGKAGVAPLGIERIRPAPRIVAEADVKPGGDVVLPLALLGYQNQQYILQPFLPPLLVSVAGIHRILTNPFYAGLLIWNGTASQGAHQPMISLDEFERIQKQLRRPKKERPVKQVFPFTGLIRCGDCGFAVTAEVKVKPSGKTYTLPLHQTAA